MKRLAAILTILLTGASGPRAGEKPAATVKDFALADAKGTKHTTDTWKGKTAVVLVFLGTECPVSNGYSPEYRRLVGAYAGKGVLFYGVHPDPDVTAEVAAKHAAEYRLPFPVLLDPTQRVAKQAGVTVVPEAVVLSPKGQVLYRGRIDDLYTPDGKRREEPQTRDLEAALRAVLAGKSPPVAQTKAFGCPLPLPIK
ncbi:MAG TPA: redoxin domain-containing protein [Gemmataceae bacterium]|nr:redoxin domain-containing protein [Gemmataceae bacterium]